MSLWVAASIASLSFLAYKLHDLQEPFAFGHARWADAYTYLFARSHLDLGLASTLGLNVEGITASREPIFYLSGPPLGGLIQAVVVALLGGEFWTVRILPFLFTFMALALIAALAYRLRGPLSAPTAILLFVGIPFVLEYGSSNEGHQVFALVAGLAGYLCYSRFLDSGRWRMLVLSATCFVCGLAFNWLAGFMALAMLAHLWLQPMAWRIKIIATIITGAALGLIELTLLFQQYIVTGSFLYPLLRALERGGMVEGDVVSWGSLIEIQTYRYWGYFGPVVTALSIYWLARCLLPRPNWQTYDGWAVLLWSPGLVYGFLLRDAAYNHDFLMLGFLPGAVFMATLGFNRLMEDLGRITADRPFGRIISVMAAVFLLGTHAAVAIRSAQNFETQEHTDLTNGGARIALYLKDLSAKHVIVADWSLSMASRVDSVTGYRYASLWPYIDYLVRRPVRVVRDIHELRSLLCEVAESGNKLVLLQQKQRQGSESQRIRIVDGVPVGRVDLPAAWVAQQIAFDQISVIHLMPPPAEECPISKD